MDCAMKREADTGTVDPSPCASGRHWIRRLLGLPLLLLVFTTFLVPTVDAKVGLNYLSSDQQKQLWRNIAAYAKYEAFLNYCETTSRVERRIWAAAGPCVTRDSLNKVSGYYRRKLREHAKKFPTKAMIKENSAFRCDRKKHATLIKKIKGLFNTAVADIDRMCRRCFFC